METIESLELNKHGEALKLDLSIIESLIYKPFKTKGDRYLIDIFKNSFCVTRKGYGGPFECFTCLLEMLSSIDLSAYYGKEISKKDLANSVPGIWQMEYTLGVVIVIENWALDAIEKDVFNTGIYPYIASHN